MFHTILNAVLFQCLWFAAILYGWVWGVAPLLILLLHFLSQVKDPVLRVLPFIVAVLGIALDSVLSVMGVYQFYPENLLLFGTMPLWLCFMWLGFSMTLPLSLCWVFRYPMVMVLFFSLGGPASYYAGVKLGALSFEFSSIYLLVIEWFVVSLVTMFLFRAHLVQRREKVSDALTQTA